VRRRRRRKVRRRRRKVRRRRRRKVRRGRSRKRRRKRKKKLQNTITLNIVHWYIHDREKSAEIWTNYTSSEYTNSR